jgi:hypothetical protein
VIQPEFNGTIWNDVFRVQTRPGDPVLNVRVRIYDVSALPVVTQFTTTLQPGVWHGFSLGSAAADRGYVTEISPVTLAEAVVEDYRVQPEFDGSAWNDVLRIRTRPGDPSLQVHIRVHETGALTPCFTYTADLAPGVLHGFLLGTSANARAYIAEITPQTDVEAIVERCSIQPEFNGSIWRDVLRVKITAGSPAMAAELRVYPVEEPPVLPPVHESVPSFLATPAPNALYEIPVLIMRYLPTQDGVNLDTSVDPDYWWLNPLTLAELKSQIDSYDYRIKFALEEGSRYHAYSDSTAHPSLGYRLVDYITVYEKTPAGGLGWTCGTPSQYPVYKADYHSIFERFDVQHYVNDLGVKEIWFWSGGFDCNYPSYDPDVHDPSDFRMYAESNMSSPVTGDISNSDRNGGDLPVYDHTYIVYGYNFRRSQAEALENHGHQNEHMWTYANCLQDGNDDLFWRDFVGQEDGRTILCPWPGVGTFITGRAGWTHMPPNTTQNYDWCNPAWVASDIEDWRPDKSGQTTLVSCSTWNDMVFPWPGGGGFPGQTQSQWFIYWWQSVPGYGAHIPYGIDEITNWWSFIGAWDTSIQSGWGLWAPAGVVSVDEPVYLPAGPAALDVSPPVPNPASRLVRLDLRLSAEGVVRATVYNVAGRAIRRLAARRLEAGTHQLTWDGTTDVGGRAAAGVYFVRVEALGETKSRKIVVSD